MDIYKKENTYLVFDKSNKEFARWNCDNKIFFAGSEEDALFGLKDSNYKAVRVCDCPSDIQKEYEQRIDECILSGEI